MGDQLVIDMRSIFRLVIIYTFIINVNNIIVEGSPISADAYLVRNCSDQGIDINRNGLYDVLSVDIGVNVKSPGEYSITGSLCGSGNKTIWSIDHSNFSRGYNAMHLIYNGKTINKMKSNGRFIISDLTLMRESSDTNLSICDYIQNAYETSAYNYSDFES